MYVCVYGIAKKNIYIERFLFFFTNERPGSDHVTLGPMRGLEKNCMGSGQTDILTHGHRDSMKESAKGRFFENNIYTYIDRVAKLIAYLPPANSTTMHSRLVCQDRNLCLGSTAYLPGLVKPI